MGQIIIPSAMEPKRTLKTAEMVLLPDARARHPVTEPSVCGLCFDWEADHIARYLRAEDKRELEAIGLVEPLAAIKDCLRRSGVGSMVYRLPARVMPWEPVAVFGCAPVEGMAHLGRPWLVGTRRMAERGIHVLRFAARFLDVMQRHYPMLENYVFAENTGAIRFIKHLGFTVEEAAPWGPLEKPFCRFWRKSPDLAVLDN